jgi:signal transduction histidine kinase
MRIMQRACCGGGRGHIRLRSAAGRPKSVLQTNFGLWSALAVRLYAPPVGLLSGSARPLRGADRETWRSTFFAVAGGGLWLIVARDEWGAAGALLWIDVALGVLSVAAMQFRRRWPLAVTLVTVATTAVSASAIGAWVVCQVSLSARRRWGEILPTAVLSVATGQVLYAVQPDQTMPWYANLVFTALATGVVVAIGMYIGARRELVESLQDRADRAEREQELRVAAAKASERAGIAREMHDVLAHRMSLVALHAGALAYRTDLSLAETREAAGIIQANSQGALADLREILGLLRDTRGGADGAGARPQPTLGDLDTLLETERASGAHITLNSDLDDSSEPPLSIGRSAYRIVEEGLTNARKHARHAAVTVELTGQPGIGLDLCVRNPVRVGTRHPGNGATGFGLIGLAERATACHGRFSSGLTPEGDFLLEAWLPWDR